MMWPFKRKRCDSRYFVRYTYQWPWSKERVEATEIVRCVVRGDHTQHHDDDKYTASVWTDAQALR